MDGPLGITLGFARHRNPSAPRAPARTWGGLLAIEKSHQIDNADEGRYSSANDKQPHLSLEGCRVEGGLSFGSGGSKSVIVAILWLTSPDVAYPLVAHCGVDGNVRYRVMASEHWRRIK